MIYLSILECPGGVDHPCSGQGECLDGWSGTGECMCNGNFTGSQCEICLPGKTGQFCNESKYMQIIFPQL